MALWAAWNPLQAAALFPVPEGPEMYRCVICRFDVQFDDVAVPGGHGGCICVHCYRRETQTEKPMDKQLRKQLIETLAGVSY